MTKSNYKVGVIMGSDSDYPVMKEAVKILKNLNDMNQLLFLLIELLKTS